MPTYEYKCKKCGHRFEKFQSIMAGPIRKCPECGKNAVERLISAGGGLIFKGSGFYITDYRDAAYTDKAKADASAGKTESEPKSAEGEAKPAAAADAKGDAKKSDKPETKTETKAETKPDAKAESKPAKPEPKPAAKSSSKKR